MSFDDWPQNITTLVNRTSCKDTRDSYFNSVNCFNPAETQSQVNELAHPQVWKSSADVDSSELSEFS